MKFIFFISLSFILIVTTWFGIFGFSLIFCFLLFYFTYLFLFSESVILRAHGIFSYEKKPKLLQRSLEGLQTLVSSLSVRLDVPEPKILWVTNTQPFAFSLYREKHRPLLVLSSGNLGFLNPQELTTLLAIELCKIKSGQNRFRNFLLAVNYSLFFPFLIRAEKRQGLWLVLGTFIFPFFWKILKNLESSQKQIKKLDQMVVQVTGDPGALVSLLVKFDKKNQKITPQQLPFFLFFSNLYSVPLNLKTLMIKPVFFSQVQKRSRVVVYSKSI